MYTDGISIGWFAVSLSLPAMFIVILLVCCLIEVCEYPYTTRPFIVGLPFGLVGIGVFYLLFSGAWDLYSTLALLMPAAFSLGMLVYFLRLGGWDIGWHMDELYPKTWFQFACGAAHSYALFGILVYYANVAVLEHYL